MDANSAYEFIRSRFVQLKETRTLVKKYGLKIKYGFFSKEEAQKVEKQVHKFLKERNLSMRELQRHLVEDTEFPIHDLLFECTQLCELRTYKSVHTHIMYIFHPYIRQTWKEEEEIQLLDLVNQKGFKWKEIGYHISKYKDMCLSRYLKLKGENSKHLTKSFIENLLAHMPITDEEWAVLCNEVHLSKAQISRLIEKHLNGKQLQLPKCHLKEIELCLWILNHNHYCKFHIDVQRIKNYLESDPLQYGFINKIQGGLTPFVSSRGNRKQRTQSVIYNATDKSNENREVDSNDLEQDDAFESIIENILKAKEESDSQTRFLQQFLEFFKLDPRFNLNIIINRDDIFWFNITREMVIEKSEAVAKCNLLSRQYNWKTFQDIYDTVMKISYDYVILRIKQALASNQGQLIESPSLSDSKQLDSKLENDTAAVENENFTQVNNYHL